MKIFTFLVAVLFAGIFSASAEKVSFEPCDYDDNALYKDFESDLVRNSDGSYTIVDFFNSGKSVSFKFDAEEALASYSDITFTSPLKNRSKGYNYLMFGTGDDDYIDIEAYDLEDNLEYLYFPYVADSYCYVQKTDDEYADEYGRYTGVICMKAFVNGETPTGWIYVYFYFNEMPIPAVEEVTSNTIDVTLKILDADSEEEVGEPIDTKFTIKSNGEFVLEDFLYSNNSVTWKLGEWYKNDYNETVADMKYIGNVKDDGDSGLYLMQVASPNKHMVCEYDEKGGATVSVKYPTVYEGNGYSVVYKDDDVYEASIDLSYYINDDWVDLLVRFTYKNSDIPTSGVDNISLKSISDLDANAPVEFFNLQGVKVANPENGVFIRRQGSKVSKVVR